MTYLLHSEIPTVLTAEFDREFPLIKYAASFWPWHYRAVTDDTKREELDILGLALVETKMFCFTNWLRAFNHDRPWEFSMFSSKRRNPGSPLYYMLSLGIIGAVQTLLNSGADFNEKGGAYDTAMSATSYNGREEMALLLLKNGANINAEGRRFGSELSAPSSKGHE